MTRRGGIFRRFVRALTRPFRARVKVAPPGPPEPPDYGGGPSYPPGDEWGSPQGWHLVGYYSPATIHKDNWQNMEAGDSEPTDREFHRSPVLRFRLDGTDKYRSFLGPTDATIDQIIAYLIEQYGEEAG